MAHLVEKGHFVDKQTLDRLETVAMLGIVGSGLTACVIGAAIYDIGRLFSIW